MGADLRGVHAKIYRGNQHFYALVRSVRAWSQSRPHRFVLEEDPDDSEHKRLIERIQINRSPDVIRWGLLLGDALNDYRSALDHLVYALAVHFTGIDPPPGGRWLQFPICDTPDNWRADRTQRQIAGLPARVRAEIHRLQPYVGAKPTDHPTLTILRDLNDWDKHRLLHVAVVVPEKYSITLHRARGECSAALHGGPTEHNAPVLTLTFTEPNRVEDVDVGLNITLFIGFEWSDVPPRYLGITTAAGSVAVGVRRVVGTLEQFGR